MTSLEPYGSRISFIIILKVLSILFENIRKKYE